MKLKYTTATALENVDIENLYLNGKRFALIDIDNTLTQWRSMDVADNVKAWMVAAKNRGFVLFLLSNNHNTQRSRTMAEALGAKWCEIKHKKPSKKAFDEALAYLNADNETTVMIGDQLYGDMLGASRAGIDGILLDPISKKEAPITKILRVREKLMGRRLVYRGNEKTYKER